MLDIFKKKEKLVTSTSTEPEKPVDFTKFYVKPHKKKSREVTEKDLPKLMEDAHIMFQLCFAPHGMYFGGFAVHHSQVNEKDPLNFFVTYDKELIINPVMVNHTKTTIGSKEGCLSFENEPMTVVQRYNKITVEYSTLTPDGKISERITENINGKRSLVYQHEIDHANAKFIFNL